MLTYEQEIGTDTWEQSALHVGRALGREVEAQQIIDDVYAKIDGIKQEHPEFEGKTFAFVLPFTEGVLVVSSPDDFSAKFMAQLGLELAPAIEALGVEQGNTPRAQVSLERLDVLEADVAVINNLETDRVEALVGDPLFQQLELARHTAYFTIPGLTTQGIGFPSVVSVPYVLDQIVPQLSQALGSASAALPATAGATMKAGVR